MFLLIFLPSKWLSENVIYRDTLHGHRGLYWNRLGTDGAGVHSFWLYPFLRAHTAVELDNVMLHLNELAIT